MACEDAIAALAARVDQRYEELRSLRGVVSRRLRSDKAAQDDAEQPNGDEPSPLVPPVSSTSTAHLSRRFKVT